MISVLSLSKVHECLITFKSYTGNGDGWAHVRFHHSASLVDLIISITYHIECLDSPKQKGLRNILENIREDLLSQLLPNAGQPSFKSNIYALDALSAAVNATYSESPIPADIVADIETIAELIGTVLSNPNLPDYVRQALIEFVEALEALLAMSQFSGQEAIADMLGHIGVAYIRAASALRDYSTDEVSSSPMLAEVLAKAEHLFRGFVSVIHTMGSLSDALALPESLSKLINKD